MFIKDTVVFYLTKLSLMADFKKYYNEFWFDNQLFKEDINSTSAINKDFSKLILENVFKDDIYITSKNQKLNVRKNIDARFKEFHKKFATWAINAIQFGIIKEILRMEYEISGLMDLSLYESFKEYLLENADEAGIDTKEYDDFF